MAGPNLSTSRSISNTPAEHAADHNAVHGIVDKFDTTASPSDGQPLSFDAATGVYLPRGSHGAVLSATMLDGTTDATAALQAAINRLPVTTGVPAVPLDLGAGTLRITNTIQIDKRAVWLVGVGIGNPSNYSNPGQGTTIRWDGAAGIPMFHVTDASHITFENLLIQGNTTNRPSEGIYFDSAGGTTGTNQQIKLKNVRIGSFSWTNPTTPTGTPSLDYGVRFGGTNANNDQMSLQDVVFSNCGTAGFALDNTQSIWGESQNVYFDTCAIGFRTYASHTIFNATFNACTKDIETHSSCVVNVFGWYTESSGRIFEMIDSSSLSVTGGWWTVNSAMGGATYFANADDLHGNLHLQSVKIVFQITAIPLKVRGSYNPTPYVVSIKGCTGLDTLALLDIQGYSVSGKTFVDINSEGIVISKTITNTALTVDAGVDIQTFTASGTWTKPAGAKTVRGVLIAGGTGGASGRRGAAGSVRCGGGGGGGGGYTNFVLDPADLAATVAVTIGAGGAGGAAVTANDTNGNNGVAGGLSSFSTHAVASLGGVSVGGTNALGTGGSGGVGQVTGGAGGSASATGGAGNAAGVGSGAGGAGAGGGITSADAASAGGLGLTSRSQAAASVAGGVVDSTAPSSGTGPTAKGVPGPGAGGGAASITTVAQTGASPNGYGGGGGGGGASLNGNNSGAGGAGAGGYCIVITTY